MSDAPEKETAAAPANKSGMMTYIILGVVGLLLAAAAAGGTYFMLKPKASAAPADSTATHAEKDSAKDSTKKHPAEPHATAESGDTESAPAKTSSAAEHHADSAVSRVEAKGDKGDIDINSPEFMAEVQRNMDALNMNEEDHLAAVDSAPAVSPDSAAAAALDDREKKLDDRDKALSARETELAALQKKVEKQMAVIEQSASSRILNLAKMYDGMDPKAVAKLAENLDDQTIVLLLPRMKQKNASDVLAAMPPVRAAKLSQQLISIGE